MPNVTSITAGAEPVDPPKVFHRHHCEAQAGRPIAAYLGRDRLTINDLFKPVFEEDNRAAAEMLLTEQLDMLDNPVVDSEEPRLFRSCNHRKLRHPQTKKPLLWLLAGSPSLSFHETVMGSATRSSHTEKSSTVKVGLCRYILDQLKRNFDMILVDLSPSCSAMNMAMVMSCDYVLPPCFLDMYSCESVHGLLTEVLPRWFTWLKATAEFQESTNGYKFVKDANIMPFLVRKTPPKILPFICTSYDVDIYNNVQYHHTSFYKTIDIFVGALLKQDYTIDWLLDSIDRDKEKAKYFLEVEINPVVQSFFPAPTASGLKMVINSVARMHAALQVSHENGVTLMELDDNEYYKCYPELKPGSPPAQKCNKKRKRLSAAQKVLQKEAVAQELAMTEFRTEVPSRTDLV